MALLNRANSNDLSRLALELGIDPSGKRSPQLIALIKKSADYDEGVVLGRLECYREEQKRQEKLRMQDRAFELEKLRIRNESENSSGPCIKERISRMFENFESDQDSFKLSFSEVLKNLEYDLECEAKYGFREWVRKQKEEELDFLRKHLQMFQSFKEQQVEPVEIQELSPSETCSELSPHVATCKNQSSRGFGFETDLVSISDGNGELITLEQSVKDEVLEYPVELPPEGMDGEEEFSLAETLNLSFGDSNKGDGKKMDLAVGFQESASETGDLNNPSDILPLSAVDSFSLARLQGVKREDFGNAQKKRADVSQIMTYGYYAESEQLEVSFSVRVLPCGFSGDFRNSSEGRILKVANTSSLSKEREKLVPPGDDGLALLKVKRKNLIREQEICPTLEVLSKITSSFSELTSEPRCITGNKVLFRYQIDFLHKIYFPNIIEEFSACDFTRMLGKNQLVRQGQNSLTPIRGENCWQLGMVKMKENFGWQAPEEPNFMFRIQEQMDYYRLTPSAVC